jgi:hypothetical protein
MVQKKTCKRLFLFEPALLPIIEAQSKALGCAGSRKSSVSDIARRAIKTLILQRCPNLKNIEEVDWTEVYTAYFV